MKFVWNSSIPGLKTLTVRTGSAPELTLRDGVEFSFETPKQYAKYKRVMEALLADRASGLRLLGREYAPLVIAPGLGAVKSEPAPEMEPAPAGAAEPEWPDLSVAPSKPLPASMTVAELKTELGEMGIDFALNAKKSELVELVANERAHQHHVEQD